MGVNDSQERTRVRPSIAGPGDENLESGAQHEVSNFREKLTNGKKQKGSL